MIYKVLSNAEMESFSKSFTSYEILVVLKHMKGRKALGPNRLQAGWDIWG